MRVLLSAMLLCACTAQKADAPITQFGDALPPLPAPASGAESPYRLVFADEFETASVDPSKWVVWEGERRHPHTINTSSRDTVETKDGSLRVSAREDAENEAFPYTAGYISTDGTFAQTYGKIEFRLRCEFAPGLWYAVWGRPWTNAVPEIDVEFLAENVTQVWLVNHWALPPAAAEERRRFVTVNGADITDFHTYTVTWSPERVEWDIDGAPYMRVEDREQGVPHEPMFWTINTWVGGWAGVPTPATKMPAHFEVDWIRVYRTSEWLVPPQVRIGNPRARYSVGDNIRVEIADFDSGAVVEVWEGTTLVDTMTKPPFHWKPSKLSRAAHALTFVATDGARRASTSLDVVVY